MEASPYKPMDTKVRLYFYQPDTNIFNDAGNITLERAGYVGDINERSSLIRLLYLFESPAKDILDGIVDTQYRIEEIIPVSPLLLMLLKNFKSPYWIGLLFKFLLDEDVEVKLSTDAIDAMMDRTQTAWLPQKNFHSVMRIVNKSNRLNR